MARGPASTAPLDGRAVSAAIGVLQHRPKHCVRPAFVQMGPNAQGALLEHGATPTRAAPTAASRALVELSMRKARIPATHVQQENREKLVYKVVQFARRGSLAMLDQRRASAAQREQEAAARLA